MNKTFYLLICFCMLCCTTMRAQSQATDVKPEIISASDYVVQGGTYKAKIVPVSDKLSKQTRVFVNGKEVKDGVYKATGSSLGVHRYKGYVLVGNDTTKIPFSGKYEVVYPSVSVMKDGANYVYRYIGNKFLITAPGCTDNMISVECVGAQAKHEGRYWLITPNDSLAKVCSIKVFANINGKKTQMGQQSYRINDYQPSPYLVEMERPMTEKGGIIRALRKFFKNTIVAVSSPEDCNLNGSITVTGFDVLFTDGEKEHCSGQNFSSNVLKKISELNDGSMFVIAAIKAEYEGHVFDINNPLVVEIKR